MKISIEDLARFGMNRVGLVVKITPSDNGGKTYGVQVTTSPYANNEVIAAVQSMVGDSLESGVMSASALMTTDGSLTCKGFTSQARGRLSSILGEFSRSYRKIIEFQEETLKSALRVAAREAAQFMLYHEPKNGFGVKLHFGVTDESTTALTEGQDGTVNLLFLDQLTRIIDNADFLAWHHARLQKALDPMVLEELRLQLPLAREELTQRLESFDRMAAKLYAIDDERTNPAGVRRT